MRIRHRITLWITGAGLLAGLLFSLVIAFELIELPYELLDEELNVQADTLLAGLDPGDGAIGSQAGNISTTALSRLYWCKIFNENQEVIYASDMVPLVDLPLRHKTSGYTVNTTVPEKAVNKEEDDDDPMAFRVRVETITHHGHAYLVQIARPIDQLAEVILDLKVTLFLGLAGSAVVLVIAGYYFAGRILQPISTINKLAREINDKTLDARIPLGRNRDELYELSSSLNMMFDRLHYSFQQQKEFIANASHELKTPITTMRLVMEETLQRNGLQPALQKQLITLSETLYRMDRLVRNLLDLSILEVKETLSGSHFSLNELVEQVREDFQVLAEKNNLRFTVQMDTELQMYADREKIRRLLINILDNAVKYNRDNGEIRFQAAKEGKEIVLTLFNTGPGIPADDLSKVFDQFYRVEKSRSAAYGGSGLGLTIVKRIVQLHGGNISLQSKIGRWTLMHITLPVSV